MKYSLKQVIAVGISLAFLSAEAVAAKNDPQVKPAALNNGETNYKDGGLRDISAIGNRNVGCGRDLS